MHLLLITLDSGDNALIVNRQLVATSEPGFENPSYLETLAEKLATASQSSLSVRRLPVPASPEWTWENVVTSLAIPPSCAKCGCDLDNGFCTDLACPYCDWPQYISLHDLETLSSDAISRKHGYIRATAFTADDDQTFGHCFDAAPYLLLADDDLILRIAASVDPCSVRIAFDAESRNAFFIDCPELEPFKDLPDAGYIVTANLQDFLWALLGERYGVWARSICAAHGHALRFASKRAYGGGTATMPLLSLDEEASDWIVAHNLSPSPQDTRPLFCTYNAEGTFVDGGRSLVGRHFFCDDRGYTEEEIANIQALPIDGVWVSPDYGFEHTIKRIR